MIYAPFTGLPSNYNQVIIVMQCYIILIHTVDVETDLPHHPENFVFAITEAAVFCTSRAFICSGNDEICETRKEPNIQHSKNTIDVSRA